MFDGEVTPGHLENWFRELDLDPGYLPPPIRAVDAFEKVTGPDGVRISYPLDDPSAWGVSGKSKGKKRRPGKSAALMVRPVRSDGGEIVRHVVREVRDEENTSLSYDARMGFARFVRDNEASEEGAGRLEVEPDQAAISALPDAEQATVRAMLGDIETSFTHRITYLSADRLRKIIRTYIEDLNAIMVRPTGGVYFVHRQHAETLAALRELTGRFGEGSHLIRVPLPDQAEMREMVIGAFTTKAKSELDRLASDIAAAQRNGDHGAAQKLYARFAEVKQSADEHAALLSTSLEDTETSMALVQSQLGSLLAADTGGDDQDD